MKSILEQTLNFIRQERGFIQTLDWRHNYAVAPPDEPEPERWISEDETIVPGEEMVDGEQYGEVAVRTHWRNQEHAITLPA
jgi:hypothetical protein